MRPAFAPRRSSAASDSASSASRAARSVARSSSSAERRSYRCVPLLSRRQLGRAGLERDALPGCALLELPTAVSLAASSARAAASRLSACFERPRLRLDPLLLGAEVDRDDERHRRPAPAAAAGPARARRVPATAPPARPHVRPAPRPPVQHARSRLQLGRARCEQRPRSGARPRPAPRPAGRARPCAFRARRRGPPAPRRARLPSRLSASDALELAESRSPPARARPPSPRRARSRSPSSASRPRERLLAARRRRVTPRSEDGQHAARRPLRSSLRWVDSSSRSRLPARSAASRSAACMRATSRAAASWIRSRSAARLRSSSFRRRRSASSASIVGFASGSTATLDDTSPEIRATCALTQYSGTPDSIQRSPVSVRSRRNP